MRPWTMQPFLGRLWQMTHGSRQLAGRQASRLLKRSSSGATSWLDGALPAPEVEGWEPGSRDAHPESSLERGGVAGGEQGRLPSGTSRPSSGSPAVAGGLRGQGFGVGFGEPVLPQGPAAVAVTGERGVQLLTAGALPVVLIQNKDRLVVAHITKNTKQYSPTPTNTSVHQKHETILPYSNKYECTPKT